MSNHGLVVVAKALEQAKNPPEGLSNEGDVPELSLVVVGHDAPLVGIVSIEGVPWSDEQPYKVVLVARRLPTAGDGWEQADVVVNPAHVVSAVPMLVSQED